MATDYQSQIDQYNKKIAEAQASGGKTSSGVTVEQLQKGLANVQSKIPKPATVATAKDVWGSSAPAITPYEKTTGQAETTKPITAPITQTQTKTIPTQTNTTITQQLAKKEPVQATPQIQPQAETTNVTSPPPQDGGTVALRATAEGQNIPISYDSKTNQVTINGVPADLTGLTLVNGSWTGDSKVIQNAINKARLGYNPTTNTISNGVSVRDYFEKNGAMVGFSNGTVTVNGVPIDTSKMALIGDRYYASPDDINKIISQISGAPSGKQEAKTQLNPQEEAIKQIQQQMAEQTAEYNRQLAELTNQLGKYKSPLQDEALAAIRTAYGNPFEYDPNTDSSLKEAQVYAERQIMEEMNSRGILNSTITRDGFATALSALIPKYEAIAFDRYNKNIDNLLKKANTLTELSNQDYERYKDYVTTSIGTIKEIKSDAVETAKSNLSAINDAIKNQLAAEKAAAEKEKQEVEAALERVKLRGYVDNIDAQIIGVNPKTLSYEAQKAAQDRINKLEDLEIQKQNQLEIIKAQGQKDQEKINFEWELKGKDAANLELAKFEEAKRENLATERQRAQTEARIASQAAQTEARLAAKDKRDVEGGLKDIRQNTKNIIGNIVNYMTDSEQKYLSKIGSAERRKLFNAASSYLSTTDADSTEVIKILSENGFTTKELNDWLAK